MVKQQIKFKKQATITTPDGCYVLERKRYFIMPHRGVRRVKHKYGNICTITKLDENNQKLHLNDVSVISEIYSFDDNRLRFLMDSYKNVKTYDTEMHDDGKELPITVVEKYDEKKQSIESLNVIRFDSDIKEQSFNNDDVTVTFMDIKVLRLLYKQLTEKSSKKDL